MTSAEAEKCSPSLNQTKLMVECWQKGISTCIPPEDMTHCFLLNGWRKIWAPKMEKEWSQVRKTDKNFSCNPRISSGKLNSSCARTKHRYTQRNLLERLKSTVFTAPEEEWVSIGDFCTLASLLQAGVATHYKCHGMNLVGHGLAFC